jgi:hypothetical protein
MDIGSFLLLLALIIAVGTFVASPLRVRRGAVGLRREDHEISELLAERERILESLDELDLDHAMGKVPDDLYPKQREILLKRGADVLRLLDEYAPAAGRKPEKPAAPAADDSGEDPLEAMIAARKAGTAEAVTGKPAEAEKPAAGKFCSNCGEKIEPGDRFCASCGKKL